MRSRYRDIVEHIIAAAVDAEESDHRERAAALREAAKIVALKAADAEDMSWP